ncbi:MBOAT family O-acyltransferase [Micavibrio aeruginosavorus]|uniref:MBOAT family protein n=1 Tax=Micavibrio aeruginosavorus (strain ARL-13) TaxID=856793 RepID=G2KSN3_MICAA|nr:MBOAT family protein [Micavibrio aeruginosavorus]AEP09633.1 MBOAT family protein [Micavibrio aeruginosavorus ARL-13]
MLFNSYVFILFFLPITFFVYFILTKQRLFTAAKAFLAGSSLFFYSWWSVAYLPLILISMIVNFSIGSILTADDSGKKRHGIKSRKAMLIAGLAFNLGLIGYFKYADFFVTNVNAIAGTDIPALHVILPLAISFYTFQQIAYLVDSYDRQTKEYDFLSYVIFVTFFPQLIAGPIIHHKEIMPQFASRWNMVKRYRNIAVGLFIFSVGLFKKVIIADSFAQWATAGFDGAQTLTFFEGWATSLSYTFQIYFDFSGYTDMAIGAALLFNIRLPQNFNSPYKATSIQDFWKRWHMTLSKFLRDYLYIPLGGNRYGLPRTCVNLFATFILGGLWHGASWMFIIWGALHGMALIVHRLWQVTKLRIPTFIAWFLTFNFINVTWVFFRATNMESAQKVLSAMLDIKTISISENMFAAINGKMDEILIATVLAFAITLFAKNNAQIESFLRHNAATLKARCCYVAAGLMLAISLFMIGQIGKSEFLYFNF